MTDEVFNLLNCFPGSFINAYRDVVISNQNNVYFNVTNCETKEEIVAKLLEWCSRDIAKGMPYRSERNNTVWREHMRDCLNKYLRTDFAAWDMEIIYDMLGNGVNHQLTDEFIQSGYDMSVLRKKE